MTLSDKSLSNINAHSLMMLSLAMAGMISGVDAQVSCTSTSPQCCWVIRSWQLMGRTTSISSTSSTACCYYIVSSTGTKTQTSGLPNVNCTGSIVKEIKWPTQSLRGSIPTDIARLVNLTFLSLAVNQLTGSIPKEIRTLGLTSLKLGENQLSGSIPPEFGNMTSLQFLELHNNQLTGSIPKELGNLRNLLRLTLKINQLSGSIPKELGNLVNLDYLWLYGNQLTGSIPPELGNLRNLTQLELHTNQLSGSIPPELGNLVKVDYFKLFKNQLTGSIPPSIGNLTVARYIWLDNNQLSGSIPEEMGKLVNLQQLSLHSNQLSGSIPQGLANSLKLSFLWVYNNPGLTGALSPQCSIQVAVLNTDISLCSCRSSSSPPAVFPPPGIPDACLASSSALALEKRALTFSQIIGNYKYTCNTDSNTTNGNPYADCLNSMSKICNSTESTFSKTTCQTGVDQMFQGMTTYWQKVRRECGQWKWIDGFIGNKDSTSCAAANSALHQNAYYLVYNLDTKLYDKVYANFGLTDSIRVRLWANTALIG